MWAWLKGIFSAPQMVTAAADAVKSGFDMIDKAFYTDQEKADNNNKRFDIWLKLQMLFANDNSVAAHTRRQLAIMIIGVFLIVILLACFVFPFNKEWSSFLLKVIIEGYLGYLALGVAGTFFALYGIGKYINKDNIPFSTESIDNPVVRERKEEEPTK